MKGYLFTIVAGIGVGFLVPLPAVAPCPELSADEQALLNQAWKEREHLGREIATAKAALEPWIGTAPSFDQLPEHQRPAHIAAEVNQHYDRRVSKIHWVDCVEAPCIVAVELIGPDQTAMQATVRPLQEAFRSKVQWQWTAGETRAFMTIPLGLPHDSGAVRHRINLREDLLRTEMRTPRP